jgi:hypothetical protein
LLLDKPATLVDDVAYSLRAFRSHWERSMSEQRIWHVMGSDRVVTEETDASLHGRIVEETVTPETWIWCDGMEDWKPAGEIAGLLESLDTARAASGSLVRLGNTPSAGYGAVANRTIRRQQAPTLIRQETRRRGFFGHLFKWLFIIFNCVMALWLFTYWNNIGNQIGHATSDAERIGGTIGGTLGTAFLVFFWLAGSVILGLLTIFTRGKKIVIEQVISTEDRIR